eukprot:scaffold1277_cov253-Pinguiococcus_pyrenoidosus.AAC.13
MQQVATGGLRPLRRAAAPYARRRDALRPDFRRHNSESREEERRRGLRLRGGHTREPFRPRQASFPPCCRQRFRPEAGEAWTA